MANNGLSVQDLEQLKAKGISRDVLEKQLTQFEQGFPAAKLAACATVGNGIVALPACLLDGHEDPYRFYSGDDGFKVVKFVPASGAATRMFKDLYALYNRLKAESDADSATGLAVSGAVGAGSGGTAIGSDIVLDEATQAFFDQLPRFPFYAELKKTLMARTGLDLLETAVNRRNFLPILECLLESGMGYGRLPKALLPFHTYEDGSVTAMEEHFDEAAQYAAVNGHCHLHFTISEEYRDLFLKKVAEVQPKYEKKYGLRYHVDHSVQKPSTDTVAVTTDNGIYRDEQQRMVFRPGGHGALIENLNDIDADLIFIKNIDNVCIGTKRAVALTYKRAMADFLLQRRHIVFAIMEHLAAALGEPAGVEAAVIQKKHKLAEMPWREWLDLLNDDFQIRVCKEFMTWPLELRARYLFTLLNRPMRVCGMVRNEGEPGGGPFWVSRVRTFAAADGGAEVTGVAAGGTDAVSEGAGDSLRLWPVESLQIVEASQINHADAAQEAIFSSSTHFNPVDIVCSVRDYTGKKFDLRRFVDPETGFIARKSIKGTDIKAMELPGLWNGAMADWITIFVEEPIEVFTPVKTVNDLLRDGHRG